MIWAREIQPGMFVLKRRKSSKKKPFPFGYFTNRALIVFTIVFLLFFSMLFAVRVWALERKPATKTVTSICIQQGDSLWSIAKQYHSKECGSLTDYISEIKRSNGLKTDEIHAGAYLLVPYYAARQASP